MSAAFLKSNSHLYVDESSAFPCEDFFFSGVTPYLFYHIKQAKETKRDRFIGNIQLSMELNKIKILLGRDGSIAQNPFAKSPLNNQWEI